MAASGAAVADRPLPYEFVVLHNGELNAWALPGGKIAINRGLLTELSNEAELAAVLAHEIVHAAARVAATRGGPSKHLRRDEYRNTEFAQKSRGHLYG